MPWEFLCRSPLPSHLFARRPYPAPLPISLLQADALQYPSAAASVDPSIAYLLSPFLSAPSSKANPLPASSLHPSSSPAFPARPSLCAPAQPPSHPTPPTTPVQTFRCLLHPGYVDSTLAASDSSSDSFPSSSTCPSK